MTLVGALVLLVCLGRARRRPGAARLAAGQLVRSPSGRALLYTGLVLLANIVMFTLMIARHPPVADWMDHRYWYYTLPWLTIVLFGIVAGLNAILSTTTLGERRALQAGLALLVAGNLASLPHYRQLMVKGPWFSLVHPQSERAKVFMRTGADDPWLAPNYREFGILIRKEVGVKRP